MPSPARVASNDSISRCAGNCRVQACGAEEARQVRATELAQRRQSGRFELRIDQPARRRHRSLRGTQPSARAVASGRSRAARRTPSRSSATRIRRRARVPARALCGRADSGAPPAPRCARSSSAARRSASGSFACSIGDGPVRHRARHRDRPPATPPARPAPRPRPVSPCPPSRRTRNEAGSEAAARRRRSPHSPRARAAPSPNRARTGRRTPRRSARSRARACAPRDAGSTRGLSSSPKRLRPLAGTRSRSNGKGLATIGRSPTLKRSMAARPKPGTELVLEIDSLAHGGRGVARADRLRRLRLGRAARRQRPSPAEQGEARLRGGAARPRSSTPSPRRVPDRCVHDGEPCPGAPWQGLPYERAARREDPARRRGAAPARRPRRLRARADRAGAAEHWRYRNKLEYSFGERDGELIARLPPPRQLGGGDRRRGLPAGLGANNAARNRGPRVGAPAREFRAYDADAQAGVLRNLVVREGRRTGQIQTRLVTAPASFAQPPRRPAHRGRRAGRRHRRPDRGPRRGVPGGGAGAAFAFASRLVPSSRPTPRWRSDSARGRGRLGGALTGSERVFDLYCGIGTIGLALARDAGEVWGIEAVPEAVADAEHNARRNGIANARFIAAGRPPRRSSAARAGGLPRRRRGRPAARRALEEGGSPGDRMRGPADRLRLLQPDHARPERRPAHGGRL